jgi:allantoinase
LLATLLEIIPMKSTIFAIKGKNILCPDGIKNGILLIDGAKIIDFVEQLPENFQGKIVDVAERIVMPGLIDCHVHINEPGRTHWEGFDTATKAAAAGGITSMIEMPLNASPVTTNRTNFKIKLEATTNKLHVNCGFWGGVVPNNETELNDLLESGVFGLKAFLTHSGIDDFPNTTASHLRNALLILKKHNKPLLVHCELDEPHEDSKLLEETPNSYQAYLKSRPKSWENKAVQLMIDLCRETQSAVHLVHISSAEALPLIRAAKLEGLPITAETCPQYLCLFAEMIPDGATHYKCAPPIREKQNNELLWEALKDGTLDFIVTDHSPAPPDRKEIRSGNFAKAWGGIAGLQFLLPLIYTAAKERGFTIEQVAKLTSLHVAQFIGMAETKGKLQQGYDADIVCWDATKSFTVTQDLIHHRHKICPYEGMKLFGVVEQCWVAGELVFDKGNFLHLEQGKILLRF